MSEKRNMFEPTAFILNNGDKTPCIKSASGAGPVLGVPLKLCADWRPVSEAASFF